MYPYGEGRNVGIKVITHHFVFFQYLKEISVELKIHKHERSKYRNAYERSAYANAQRPKVVDFIPVCSFVLLNGVVNGRNENGYIN